MFAGVVDSVLEGVAMARMAPRRPVGAVDMARPVAEGTVLPSIEEAMVAPRPAAVMGPEETAERRPHTKATRPPTGTPTMDEEDPPPMDLVSMVPDNNHPARHPLQAMETTRWAVLPGVATVPMILRETAFHAPSLLRRSRASMIPPGPVSPLRWMLELMRSTVSVIAMLTLPGCWRCSKRGRRRAHTARTSKRTLSHCSCFTS